MCCATAAIADSTNSVYAHFFLSNKAIHPRAPQKTAKAKAAVTQAGYSRKNSACCSGGISATISSVTNTRARYANTPMPFHNRATTLTSQNQTGGFKVEESVIIL